MMSRYMQVDVRIIPFYEKTFQQSFPNLAEMLRQAGYYELGQGDTSFYHMADRLEDILDNPGTSGNLKEKLGPHVKRIMELRESAREHLLARRLNQLDRVLYRMEDEFSDLEGLL